jgi:hypothetical protein
MTTQNAKIKHDYEAKVLPGGGVSFIYGRLELRYFGWNYVYLDGARTATLVLIDSSRNIIDKQPLIFKSADPESNLSERFPNFKGASILGDEVTPIGKNQAGNALYLEGCQGDGPMVKICEGKAPLTKEERQASLFQEERVALAERQVLLNKALRRLANAPDNDVKAAADNAAGAFDSILKS